MWHLFVHMWPNLSHTVFKHYRMKPKCNAELLLLLFDTSAVSGDTKFSIKFCMHVARVRMMALRRFAKMHALRCKFGFGHHLYCQQILLPCLLQKRCLLHSLLSLVIEKCRMRLKERVNRILPLAEFQD